MLQTRATTRSERDVLRQYAYGEPSKLAARPRLWSYLDRVWETGRIYSVVNLTGRETVVDGGCGNGRDLAASRADGHTGLVIGIDFSHGMLVSIGAGTANRVNGDALTLPLAGSCADVVCAMHMLYHAPDIEAALYEAKRIMKRGGFFVCSTDRLSSDSHTRASASNPPCRYPSESSRSWNPT